MATGRDIQLTRQIGEHLVAAKLGRLGYIAAPFAGNVPLFDLLAADMRGYAVPVQVKAIKGPHWQLRADTFLEIEIVGNHQEVKGKKALRNPDLLCIFVLLGEDEKDTFYVLRLKDLQDIVFRGYDEYIRSHGGRRPKKPESMHCALWPEDLESYKERWDLVASQFPAQH